MLKKIFILGVALIMMLGVFGLTACGKPKGTFYSLDDAFDNDWLTTEQLQSIAYYYYEESISHDHVECEPFVPMPKKSIDVG